ncbi:MAG TPA: hypothetical protein VGQ73_09920 [Gemmatimonadales bacterium]|nr:hypothetical protein [Gemmatimonadales bacterium]
MTAEPSSSVLPIAISQVTSRMVDTIPVTRPSLCHDTNKAPCREARGRKPADAGEDHRGSKENASG